MRANVFPYPSLLHAAAQGGPAATAPRWRGTLTLRGGGSCPGDSDGADDLDIGALDFEAALRAAREAKRAGASCEQALANADLALAGSVTFTALPRLPVAGGFMASGWLGEMEAKVRLHEAVTAAGWEQGPEGKRLTVYDPLPEWVLELARKLAPAFGGSPPDECDMFALEHGEEVPARLLAPEETPPDEGQEPGSARGVVACLSLAGPGRVSLSAHGRTEVLQLDVGSCMLLQDGAPGVLSVGVSAPEQHHIFLVFRRRQ